MRLLVALVAFLSLTPVLSRADDLPVRHAGLSQFFVAEDGVIAWAPPFDAPLVVEMVDDFWRMLALVAPVGATFATLPLPVHGSAAPLTMTLSVLDVPTRTAVCTVPVPLTAGAQTVLQTLGCVHRTDAENQQLLDAARQTLERHSLTLLPRIKS